MSTIVLQDPVQYSIITKQGVTLFFKIDPTQGIIRTNAALYTDQSRKYEVSLSMGFL